MKYQKIAIWRVFLPKRNSFVTHAMCTHPTIPAGPTRPPIRTCAGLFFLTRTTGLLWKLTRDFPGRALPPPRDSGVHLGDSDSSRCDGISSRVIIFFPIRASMSLRLSNSNAFVGAPPHLGKECRRRWSTLSRRSLTREKTASPHHRPAFVQALLPLHLSIQIHHGASTFLDL
jgi:hypothetical protein